jgi:hypothetical protein
VPPPTFLVACAVDHLVDANRESALLVELRETPPTLTADCRFARLFAASLQSLDVWIWRNSGFGLAGGFGDLFRCLPGYHDSKATRIVVFSDGIGD